MLEGLPGGRMRCGESAVPEGAMDKGRITDPAAVGLALRQLLARSEISTRRALVAASDTVASFRVFTFPNGTADAEIDAAVRSQLPSPSEQMALRHTEILAGRGERTIFAAAWDRTKVKAIADTTRQAGLEPAVVELKSVCVARAVPIASCILLDMSAEPFEVVLIDNHVPRVWHSFKVHTDGADYATVLAGGLKPVLAFYRNSGRSGFGAKSPILVRSELPSGTSGRLAELTGHPVEPLPQPPRADPDVPFGPYLTCIGLVMRRHA